MLGPALAWGMERRSRNWGFGRDVPQTSLGQTLAPGLYGRGCWIAPSPNPLWVSFWGPPLAHPKREEDSSYSGCLLLQLVGVTTTILLASCCLLMLLLAAVFVLTISQYAVLALCR